MLGCEVLPNLNAAPVPVHVAEAADVHEDVEAELLAGAEGAQHFIVPTAVTQTQINDFLPDRFSRGLNGHAKLSVGIVGVLVDQSGGQFHFDRFMVEQINQGRGSDG